MTGEVSPEQAEKILAMLTEGKSMGNVNTTLALRLIPLAEEIGRAELVERLLEHAHKVAEDDIERGWVDFEKYKLSNYEPEKFAELSARTELLNNGKHLSAAILHHLGLIYLSQENYTDCETFINRSLRLREELEDESGLIYGLAVLEAACKRQDEHEQALAHGTRRLELLMKNEDLEGQMEAMSDIAHTQATVGAFDAATDLYNQSLELANQLEDMSGQLVARWGLCDICEIKGDYETAMIHLSDCLHAFIAMGLTAPLQVRERLEALTNLNNSSGQE
tara:strand:- start:723 stop:1559 length:837 start_codon:yes stop_codon:yes gene_type:complete